jgi:predicted metal-dependent hydrolase
MSQLELLTVSPDQSEEDALPKSGLRMKDIEWRAVKVELVGGLKSARARVVDGELHVRVPKPWPLETRDKAVESLSRRLARQQARYNRLRQQAESSSAQVPRLTLTDPVAVRAFVERVNAETVQAPLTAVNIGSARRSRLAQLNRGSGVMTISRFCLQDVPETALRYLVIHELAHFEQGNHSPAFWALVAKHCPDYRAQRQLMQACYAAAVDKESIDPSDEPAELPKVRVQPAEPALVTEPGGFKTLVGKLFQPWMPQSE